MTTGARIRDRQAKVGVIGLGYVGLPLAVEFAKAGFRVEGFDLDPEKVRILGAGGSALSHFTGLNFSGPSADGRGQPLHATARECRPLTKVS